MNRLYSINFELIANRLKNNVLGKFLKGYDQTVLFLKVCWLAQKAVLFWSYVIDISSVASCKH